MCVACCNSYSLDGKMSMGARTAIVARAENMNVRTYDKPDEWPVQYLVLTVADQIPVGSLQDGHVCSSILPICDSQQMLLRASHLFLRTTEIKSQLVPK